MSKYTPGPWDVQMYHLSAEQIALAKKFGQEVPRALSNEGQAPVMAGTGDDRCRIAQVDSQTAFKRGKGWEVECATRDANARLIAAAPDLLEALTNLVAVVQMQQRVEALRGKDDPKAWNPALDVARAALAKAGAADKAGAL